MKIGDLKIKDEYVTCREDDKLYDLFKKLQTKKSTVENLNYIIVVDAKKPVGVISFRDVVLKLVGERRAIGEIKASDVMTTPVMTTRKDKDAKDTFNLMVQMGFRSLPVVDAKGNIAGCVTINDLAEKLEKK